MTTPTVPEPLDVRRVARWFADSRNAWDSEPSPADVANAESLVRALIPAEPAAPPEAGEERETPEQRQATIVAWLRKYTKARNRGLSAAFDEAQQRALSSAADCIERGDHLTPEDSQ